MAKKSASAILQGFIEKTLLVPGLPVGRSEFGNPTLQSNDGLGLLDAEVKGSLPALSGDPLQPEARPANGLTADVKVFVAGPDDLADETLSHLDRIPETGLRTEAFGFGELAHAPHVSAEEIGDLGANFEILPRKASIFVPGLPVTEEL